jgi:ribonuclease Z
MPNVCGIEIGGFSFGGIETCLDLPRFRLAFDMGRTPDEVVARETILFTHAHVDHMAGVAWHCGMRNLRGLKPPTYVVSHENAAAFRDLFDAWRRLDRSEMAHELVVLGPGEEWVTPRNTTIRPFRSPHRAPCQGYTLSTKRNRLAPRFAGLSRAELDAARAQGETLSDTVELLEFAFTGDTLIDVIEREETVRTARVLAIECTFLDERVPVERSRAMGHVHLDEIVERADLFQNEGILLTHFSTRYSPAEIESLLDRKLPARLRERVTPFLTARRSRA